MSEITAIIDRFEGSKAILVFADGQQLRLAKKYLGQNFKEGDQVALKVKFLAKATKAQYQKTRKLLKNILSENP